MSEKCEKFQNCPLVSHESNPGILCPFIERIVKVETDLTWLKRLIGVDLTIGVIAILFKILGG